MCESNAWVRYPNGRLKGLPQCAVCDKALMLTFPAANQHIFAERKATLRHCHDDSSD